MLARDLPAQVARPKHHPPPLENCQVLAVFAARSRVPAGPPHQTLRLQPLARPVQPGPKSHVLDTVAIMPGCPPENYLKNQAFAPCASFGLSRSAPKRELAAS